MKQLVGIIILIFLLSSSLSFAERVEKKGNFKVEGDRIVINEKESIRLNKETRIVNIEGNEVSREQLNHAMVIVIETDEKGIVKKITIEGWWD